MNESMRESLSALMDGEADELELRRLLSSVESDDELKSLWNRFHIAQSAMQKQSETLQPVLMQTDMSARISAALDSEEVYSDENKSSDDGADQASAWKRQVGSLAIAASVALFTVFGVNLYDTATGIGSLQTPELAQSVNFFSLPTTNVAVTNGPALHQTGVAAKPPSVDQNSIYTVDQRLILSGNFEQAQQNQQAVQRRLETYLLRHAENAALNNNQGMLPLARVNTFDVDEF